MTPEERVARLEEISFFQERLLQDLNAALTRQQRQLDAMERTLDEMGVRVEELRLAVEAGNAPANTPPPHYRER
jgi:SlyX protein